MTQAGEQTMETRELAFRESNGVAVSLVWRPAEDTLAVIATDTAADESFELPVSREEALDAFHHPFAYAAFRGLDVGATLEPLRL